MRKRPENVPSLFGTPVGEAGVPPFFFAPSNEGCGEGHVEVGAVGDRVMCVLPSLAESFAEPCAALGRVVDNRVRVVEGELERERGYSAHLMGVIRATIKGGVGEDRGEKPEAPLAAGEENQRALWLGVMLGSLMEKRGVPPPAVKNRLGAILEGGWARREETVPELKG